MIGIATIADHIPTYGTIRNRHTAQQATRLQEHNISKEPDLSSSARLLQVRHYKTRTKDKIPLTKGATMDKEQQNHNLEDGRGGHLNNFFGPNLHHRKPFSVNKLCL